MMEMTLKQAREKLNMTQVEVANFFGVSRRSYQDYENNEAYKDSIKYKFMLDKLTDILEDENKRILTVEEIQAGCEKVFEKYDVDYCYLFGSYAKGKAKVDSDIDLLIATSITGLKFFALVEEIRETLRKKVDVLDFNQMESNKDLLNEILKDGIKIYG
ncbi:MAG TPA: helix-turn-helix domain-containing protein [Clostridiaceae bacterium]|nr:helix-turn-helix domain-containing protein [Clostridiaceae bacterium]